MNGFDEKEICARIKKIRLSQNITIRGWGVGDTSHIYKKFSFDNYHYFYIIKYLSSSIKPFPFVIIKVILNVL